MSSTKSSFLAALAAAALPSTVHAEAITGTVEFTGTPPAMARLDRGSDPFCAKKPMNDESVIVKGNKLANVWVHVIKGAADSKAPADAPEVVVDQVDCTYLPRMQFAQVGQKVVARNGDPILHNVHTYLGVATVFNKGMPNASSRPVVHVATKAGVIRWKCDVHAWMRAFVGVNKNPYQAVSSGDGTFTIDGIPPGSYTLEAWHERYGAKTLEVKVEAGKPAVARFGYDGTEKGS